VSQRDQDLALSVPAFDELEAQFRRVGRAEPSVRTPRRRVLVATLVAATAIGTPAAAVALISDGDDIEPVARPVPHPFGTPEFEKWAQEQGFPGPMPAQEPPAERGTKP
jgi:hypothetical protein